MKNHIKKILVFGLLFISTIAFAFPADPDVTPDPPAPIDTYQIVLIVSAIALSYFFLIQKNAKKANKF